MKQDPKELNVLIQDINWSDDDLINTDDLLNTEQDVSNQKLDLYLIETEGES